MPSTPSPVERTSLPLRLGGCAVAYGFFCVPHRFRFFLALLLARLLEPLIARTGAWRERQRLRTDGMRETSADLLLTILTRHGVRYEPKLRFELDGVHLLPPPGSGWLLLGPHTMLSTLFTRTLDAGGYVTWAAAAARVPLPGARRQARVLLPSPTLPLRIRRKLREGCVVFAMVDRGETDAHTVEYELATGPMRVSSGLFRLALATHTPLFFIASRIEGSSVVCRLRPADPTAHGLQALLDDFASFVDPARRRGVPRSPRLVPGTDAQQSGT